MNALKPISKKEIGEVPEAVTSYLTIFMSGAEYREFFKESGFETARLRPPKRDLGFHVAGGLPTETNNLALSCSMRDWHSARRLRKVENYGTYLQSTCRCFQIWKPDLMFGEDDAHNMMKEISSKTPVTSKVLHGRSISTKYEHGNIYIVVIEHGKLGHLSVIY